MSQVDLISCLLKKPATILSPAERILAEVKLITHLYQEFHQLFQARYQSYQSLFKSLITQEEKMFGIKFMQEIIKDILSTQEYSLEGIATHTQIPEEVLSDIAAGMNTNPTFDFSRKLFELHASVRRELYDQIMRKIAAEYLAVA